MKLQTVLLLFALGCPLAVQAETLTIVGSGTVATAITAAIEEFKKTSGVEVILTPRGSDLGVLALVEGQAQIGLTIADVNDAQRQLYPAVDFHSTTVGRGAIYLVVSPDVWDAGMHALSREQVISVVEKQVTNWTELGGPNVPIRFYHPGGGTQANFVKWLYGKSTPEFRAKMQRFEGASLADFAVNVGKNRGSLAALSEHYHPGESTARKVAILTGDGPIEASSANISSGRYPMSFNLQLITNGRPQGAAKVAIEFLLSEQGQALIEGTGYARIPAHPK